MVIYTERLKLRPWEDKDASDLYRVARNPVIGLNTGWLPHENVEESAWVIRNILGGAECYAICEKDSDTPIGNIDLMLSSPKVKAPGEAELGFWLGEAHWGKGYMTEAGLALIQRGFKERKLTCIWSGYFDGNARSKRVQEKLGFLHHHTDVDVEWPLLAERKTEHVNVLTRARWEALRGEEA